MSEMKLDLSQFVIESPPGDTLAEVLAARGMTQAELALRTGRPLKTINEIIKGKANITADTALQFERVLGIAAEFWINRDAQYRESQARQAEKQEFQKYLDWLDIFPLKEMIELGWIKKFDNAVDQVLELLHYFSIAKPEHWSAYWKTAIPKIEQLWSFQHAPGSTTAWLRKGEIEFQKISCDEFQSRVLKNLLTQFPDLIDEPVNTFYSEVTQKLAQSGVAFCVVESIPGSEITAVTRWLSPIKASIQLNTHLSIKKDFWLTLYHGLTYILMQGKRDNFIIEKQNQRSSQLSTNAEKFVTRVLENTHWSTSDSEIHWETLVRGLTAEQLWQDFEEAPSVIAPTSELQSTTERDKNLESSGWPGLSAGARQVLMAAGLTDEAGNIDERLFADWVKQKLGAIESAFLQGYMRDALMDLEELHTIVRTGTNRSPALAAMLSTLTLLRSTIEKQYKPDQTTLLLEIKQFIAQTNQDTHQALKSEQRIRYSTATNINVEKSLADDLFKF